MKKIYQLFLALIISQGIFAQGTVTDFDGNVYNTVTIGTQVWLKENLRALHYSDGTIIPGVVTYNNVESYASTFGRLYTWDAAMKNTTQVMAQGACPDGWHVASSTEWLTLEDYLGGSSVAGGKMKTTTGWKSPNTGATNSSGLSILPGGEYDAYYSPNIFRLFEEYAVIWTSTEIGSNKARERYLSFESGACLIYDWYKVMKYSVRCIKNSTTHTQIIRELNVKVYPTITKDIVQISLNDDQKQPIIVQVFNAIGNKVAAYQMQQPILSIDFSMFSNGVYIINFTAENKTSSKKVVKY